MFELDGIAFVSDARWSGVIDELSIDVERWGGEEALVVNHPSLGPGC